MIYGIFIVAVLLLTLAVLFVLRNWNSFPFFVQCLLKWMGIVFICGAHSLFWGMMTTKFDFIPIILGMMTLILAYTFVETRSFYQRLRGADPLLARSIDQGINFRLVWGATVIVAYAIGPVIGEGGKGFLWAFIMTPVLMDVFIGMGAVGLTKFVFGINLGQFNLTESPMTQIMDIHYQFATYLTTVITGLAHTIILAVLCATIYLIARRRRSLKGSKK